MSTTSSDSTSPAVLSSIRSVTEETSIFSGSAKQISDVITKKRDESYEFLQKSNVLGLKAKGTFQQLDEIVTECSSEGWDGEKARPISEEVWRWAIKFLESLPLGIEAPEIGAEPDGDITLEWYRSRRWILSVSVSTNGKLHYAALFGAREQYGSEPFFGEAPKIIIDLIYHVADRNRSKIKAA